MDTMSLAAREIFVQTSLPRLRISASTPMAITIYMASYRQPDGSYQSSNIGLSKNLRILVAASAGLVDLARRCSRGNGPLLQHK